MPRSTYYYWPVTTSGRRTALESTRAGGEKLRVSITWKQVPNNCYAPTIHIAGTRPFISPPRPGHGSLFKNPQAPSPISISLQPAPRCCSELEFVYQITSGTLKAMASRLQQVASHISGSGAGRPGLLQDEVAIITG